MKRSLLLFGLTSMALSSKCQSDFVPGFIITLQNDTIHGYLNNKNISESAYKCSFRKSIDDKTAVYSPKDINGYRFENGRYYISSHTINYKEDIFLEFLLKGKVDLFYYRKEGSDFYLVKKDMTIIDLDHTTDTIHSANGEKYYHESTRYKGQLKALMNDSKELSDKSESVSYTSKNLMNLMKEYHNQTCKAGEQCIEFSKKDTRLFDVRYGVFVCAGLPVLTLDRRLMESYPEIKKWDFKGSGSKSFSAGFLIAIGMNSLTRKLSILAEPSYSLYKFKSDEQLKYTYPPSSGVRDWITFNISAIKLPLSLQYTFKNATWKLHPFLQAGAWYSYFLSTDSKMDYKLTLDNVPSNGSYQFAFGSYQIGYQLSCGLEVPYMTDKLRIAVKYEKEVESMQEQIILLLSIENLQTQKDSVCNLDIFSDAYGISSIIYKTVL